MLSFPGPRTVELGPDVPSVCQQRTICLDGEWMPLPETHHEFCRAHASKSFQREHQPRAEEGPFSPQQPLNPPPWCWNVEESAWCPSINLGKSPGKQRSWQPAPLSSPLHIPSSISSLCWVSHETLFSEPQMASSQSLIRQLCLPPSPQAFSFLTWFPRKGLSLSIFLPLCFSLSVSVSLSVPYSF